MYGCIVGKDADGVWLLAEGYYDRLKSDIDTLRKLDGGMDIRLFEIDEESMNDIRDSAAEIKDRFSGLF